MKKHFIFLMTIILCLSFSVTAYAKEEKEEKIDNSQPRLMVTDYKLDSGSLSPSKKSTLEITFKNFSQTKALSNIKLSLSDESGEIESIGMPTEYISRIYAGCTYVWKTEIKATSTAQIGQHKLSISSEYEDKYYNAYSETDTININVKQSVGLDYDGIILKAKVFQGDTETITVNLINTGKTDLRNCKVTFDIKGLESGGALFIGEIPAGESKDGNANLRVASDALGETKGKAKITYEDAYGKTHEESVEISTKIEKKPVEVKPEEKDEESKYPLWWAFLLTGTAVGGGVGAAIPITIYKTKQRKEDELRL